MGSTPCGFWASGPSLPSLYTLRAYAPRQHVLEECRSEKPQKAPQQLMKSSARRGPPKVVQAGWREGSFHQDQAFAGNEVQELLGDNVLSLMTVGKGFLSLHLSPSYSKGEKANWGREEVCGEEQSPFPFPVLLCRRWARGLLISQALKQAIQGTPPGSAPHQLPHSRAVG